MKIITIAAALLIAPDGKTLLVRKRGTQAFMQPGGKIEPGEAAAMALARELKEELGLSLIRNRPRSSASSLRLPPMSLALRSIAIYSR